MVVVMHMSALKNTFVWSPTHIQGLSVRGEQVAPVITKQDVTEILPGLDVWDMWPLALRDGHNAILNGATLWFALTAAQFPDPVERHAYARIRLLVQTGKVWKDAGMLFEVGFAPGSRDWSGSAIFDPDTAQVTLFFTAAGRAGEASHTVEQRLFITTGTLKTESDLPRIVGWSTPHEFIKSDDDIYVLANQAEGIPGQVKAFRDPAYFRDPADGHEYVLFAASYKQSVHQHNGMIGIARAQDKAFVNWSLLAPLVVADGLCNELERPHVVMHKGLYYVFWSTQASVFAPNGPVGPTGLYGMVGESLFGPYRLLNGSGLVLANPPQEPFQAYSWWVMGDLSVTSFVDYWGLQGRALAQYPDLVRAQFGGVPAPFVRLWLEDDRAGVEQ